MRDVLGVCQGVFMISFPGRANIYIHVIYISSCRLIISCHHNEYVHGPLSKYKFSDVYKIA